MKRIEVEREGGREEGREVVGEGGKKRGRKRERKREEGREVEREGERKGGRWREWKRGSKLRRLEELFHCATNCAICRLHPHREGDRENREHEGGRGREDLFH